MKEKIQLKFQSHKIGDLVWYVLFDNKSVSHERPAVLGRPIYATANTVGFNFSSGEFRDERIPNIFCVHVLLTTFNQNSTRDDVPCKSAVSLQPNQVWIHVTSRDWKPRFQNVVSCWEWEVVDIGDVHAATCLAADCWTIGYRNGIETEDST